LKKGGSANSKRKIIFIITTTMNKNIVNHTIAPLLLNATVLKTTKVLVFSAKYYMCGV
jgi:hypothetical protein